jgi:hypothetical protein
MGYGIVVSLLLSGPLICIGLVPLGGIGLPLRGDLCYASFVSRMVDTPCHDQKGYRDTDSAD